MNAHRNAHSDSHAETVLSAGASAQSSLSPAQHIPDDRHNRDMGQTLLPPSAWGATERIGKAWVQAFFDPATSTFSYVVHAGPGTGALIIDSVLDYSSRSGRTRTEHADDIISYVRSLSLQVKFILETHAHADHLSAAPYIKQHLGGQVAISSEIRTVQGVFSGIFQFPASFRPDGSDFDRLLSDGETLSFGDLVFSSHAVPGHTPACMAFEIEGALFVGDTLFMPDVGTARCDFPGGDAATLYRSIRRLLDRPADTPLYMCHDYPPVQRPFAHRSTVGDQRQRNVHIHDGVSDVEFIRMRNARDKTLEVPMLILPSIQVNVRAGKLPEPAANGKRYLQIPVDVL